MLPVLPKLQMKDPSLFSPCRLSRTSLDVLTLPFLLNLPLFFTRITNFFQPASVSELGILLLPVPFSLIGMLSRKKALKYFLHYSHSCSVVWGSTTWLCSGFVATIQILWPPRLLCPLAGPFLHTKFPFPSCHLFSQLGRSLISSFTSGLEPFLCCEPV